MKWFDSLGAVIFQVGKQRFARRRFSLTSRQVTFQGGTWKSSPGPAGILIRPSQSQRLPRPDAKRRGDQPQAPCRSHVPATRLPGLAFASLLCACCPPPKTSALRPTRKKASKHFPSPSPSARQAPKQPSSRGRRADATQPPQTKRKRTACRRAARALRSHCASPACRGRPPPWGFPPSIDVLFENPCPRRFRFQTIA